MMNIIMAGKLKTGMAIMLFHGNKEPHKYIVKSVTRKSVDRIPFVHLVLLDQDSNEVDYGLNTIDQPYYLWEEDNIDATFETINLLNVMELNFSKVTNLRTPKDNEKIKSMCRSLITDAERVIKILGNETGE